MRNDSTTGTTRRIGEPLLIMFDEPVPYVESSEETLLRQILSALAAPAEPANPQLMDRTQVAAWLGVSARTVSRRFRPTSQPVKRGKAWYSAEDIARQMREKAGRHDQTPRSRRRPANRPSPRPPTPSNDAAVEAFEKRLRSGSAKGKP